MSKTIAVHVRYKSLYISLPSSAKQQPEMTKFCVVMWTWLQLLIFRNSKVKLNINTFFTRRCPCRRRRIWVRSLLLCRRRQRNAQEFIMHVHGYCFPHLFFFFGEVLVAFVTVGVCLSSPNCHVKVSPTSLIFGRETEISHGTSIIQGTYKNVDWRCLY